MRTPRDTHPKQREEAGERGAALLSVLLLVAIMSALAVAMVDDIQFAVRRAGNAQDREQARWYALGAEELARTVVARSFLVSRGVTTRDEPWGRGVTRFPIEGGYIDGLVRDASNCFNLNSVVVAGGAERYTAREAGVRQFADVLDAAGATGVDGLGLAAALVDWIDTDAQPYGGAGAEDVAYALTQSPHRTPNTLVRDETELRALSGMTEAAYQAVRPYVCALPTASLTRLNVNTLEEADAPLLSAVFGDELDVDAARAVIRARPDTGYDTVEEFITQDALEGLDASEDARDQLDVRASYFFYESQVVLGSAYVAQSGLLHQDPDGVVRVVRRQQGVLQ